MKIKPKVMIMMNLLQDLQKLKSLIWGTEARISRPMQINLSQTFSISMTKKISKALKKTKRKSETSNSKPNKPL